MVQVFHHPIPTTHYFLFFYLETIMTTLSREFDSTYYAYKDNPLIDAISLRFRVGYICLLILNVTYNLMHFFF